MTCASAWLEQSLTTSGDQPGTRWVVYDEAWRLLRSPALLGRMQAQWKLSRAYGIANLLILHRLSDLDAVAATGTAGRAIADVVPDPSLAQFTDATKHVFSAARHRMAFSWNVLAGSANVVGR